MFEAYRIATDEEKHERHIDEYYDLLLGPDGFECFLGEPEDRTWRRDANDVVTRLNELHAASSQWISVEHSVPKDSRTVLVYAPEADEEEIWFAYREHDRWVYVEGFAAGIPITHWMEVPKPPKETRERCSASNT